MALWLDQKQVIFHFSSLLLLHVNVERPWILYETSFILPLSLYVWGRRLLLFIYLFFNIEFHLECHANLYNLFTDELLVMQKTCLIFCSLLLLQLQCLTDFILSTGSSDSWGSDILNKIAKAQVFGFRMSKSSSYWWFKWGFVWNIW